jgi:hypothetical protein
LVADTDARLYDLYGVEVYEEKVQEKMRDAHTETVVAEAATEGFALTRKDGANFHRIPAEFLIDPQGVIQVAHYGRLVTDHLPLDLIDRFAASGAAIVGPAQRMVQE